MEEALTEVSAVSAAEKKAETNSKKAKIRNTTGNKTHSGPTIHNNRTSFKMNFSP